jgi:hypothetical protein
VPAHDFSFALQLSDEPQFDGMLAELAGAVYVHAGLDAAAVAELTDSLRGALRAGAAKGHQRCDLRFAVRDATLEIAVAFGGVDQWRTSRALPAKS